MNSNLQTKNNLISTKKPTGSACPIRVLELRSASGAGGGPEKTILFGASLSQPHEFEIDVVYLKPKSDSSTILRDRARELNISYSELTGNGPLDLSQYFRLKEYIRAHPIDIVHGHEYKSNFLALMLRRSFDIQLISTVHGWTGNSFRERRVYYPADRRILRRFPVLVSVSSQITDTLVRSGVPRTRIHTIPNGIDASVFQVNPGGRAEFRKRLGIGDHEFVIGGAGRLEQQKRFDILLDAGQDIRQTTRRPIRILIAGDGRLKEDLQQQIDQSSMDGCAQLLGHQEDVRDFYSALDLFVQSSDYEGTSNAVLEAMAMQAPIVATDAGGTRDLIEDRKHGRLVPVGRPQDLADAIRHMMDNPHLSQQYAKLARQRVESDFAFPKRNQRLEQLYRQLVGR